MKKKRYVVVITALAVVVATAGPVEANSGGDGPVVAEGQVLDAKSSPVHSGNVYLIAPPKAPHDARDGDTFKGLPLDEAVIDSSGRFALSLGYTPELERYIDESSGLLNLEVVATADGQIGVYRFTVAISADRGASLRKGDITLARDEARMTDDVTITLPSGGAAGNTVSPASGLAPMEKQYGCVWTKTGSTRPWALVGSLYSTWAGFTGEYKYKVGASSTLGAAFSSTGAYGSFTSSGTTTTTSTQAWPWGPTGQFKKLYKIEWMYYHYKVHCVFELTEYTYYEEEAQYPTGGSNSVNAAAIPATPSAYCVVQDSGYNTGVKTATTWTNGVQIGAAIGIDLSINSKWTANHRMKITNSKRHKLCGTNGLPGSGYFGELVAKPA